MKEITFKVVGMRCGMCETTVNDIVRKFDGIKKVKSSHLKNQTIVVCEDNVSEEAIQKAIAGHGYDCPEFTSASYVKKGLFGFLKK